MSIFERLRSFPSSSFPNSITDCRVPATSSLAAGLSGLKVFAVYVSDVGGLCTFEKPRKIRHAFFIYAAGLLAQLALFGITMAYFVVIGLPETRFGQCFAGIFMFLNILIMDTGRETIAGASGFVTLRSVSDPKSLLGLFSCFITHDLPIVSGDSIPIRCANLQRRASPADEEFVAMPEYSLLLTWEPKSVALAGGEVLKSMQ